MHDFQGNIAILLDLQGNAVETYRYDAFGNETIYSKTPTHNPWGFSSKRTDSETGLVYFGRRYYDPTIGKWLTQDPLGVKEGPNLYAYVLNCPMTNFDEYGLYVEDDRGNMHFTKESFYNRDMASRRDGHEGRGDSSDGESKYNCFTYRDFYVPTVSVKEDDKIKEFERKLEICFEVIEYMIIVADIASTVVTISSGGAGAPSKVVTSGIKWAFQKCRRFIVDKIVTKVKEFTGRTSGMHLSNANKDHPHVEKLKAAGFVETSTPGAIAAGNRDFVHPKTGVQLRFDQGKPGMPGNRGKDHFHIHNPNRTGEKDYYLDKFGDPCPKGSAASHIYYWN